MAKFNWLRVTSMALAMSAIGVGLPWFIGEEVGIARWIQVPFSAFMVACALEALVFNTSPPRKDKVERDDP
jgi:hypothetical protein